MNDEILIVRLAGRCRNGAERDGGIKYHAKVQGSWAALCGKQPGRQSAGWVPVAESVAATCPGCVKKMAKAVSAEVISG